ncbi:MAG: hypothetical protein WC340_04110 [Kiritimatiellia bacterium]
MKNFENNPLAGDIIVYIWITIFCVLALAITIQNKLALKRIQSLLKKNNHIKGHEVGYWLKDVEYPIEYAFDILENNVVSYKNTDFFFVEAKFSVISFGRIGGGGAGMSHSKNWCLLAVGDEAIEILNNKRSLFKKISIDQNNEIGLFSIRKLFSFACLLRRESQQRVGEEQ